MRAAIALLALSAASRPSPLSLVVDSRDPALQSQRGVLTYGGRAFSGSVIDDSDARYGQRIPYQRGLRQGLAQAFYADGQVAYRRLYLHGLREGGARGVLAGARCSSSIAISTMSSTENRSLTIRTASVPSCATTAQVREEERSRSGMVKARLTTNYTVKEGRRYGLVGRFDCVTVH